MIKFRLALIIVVSAFFIICCKKANSTKTQLASLNLSNVNALVIPQDSGLQTSSSAGILYQLTGINTLSEVDFINVNDFNMNGYYSPAYFYHLNELYFMATFYIVNSKPQVIDSYIINYSDGKVFKLPEGFYPMKYNGSEWVQESYEKAILEGPENSFYFKGENRVFEITASELDLFSTQTIDIPGTSSSNFNVDIQGHIMVGNTVYTSPTITYISNVFNSTDSYSASNFNNGFSIVKLINNEIITFNVYPQNGNLVEDTLNVIQGVGNGWQYIGTFKYSNPNQIIFVFNQGIVVINDKGTSLMNFSDLQFSNIYEADQSDTHLFLFADDGNQNKVFLQITPANNPPTYTEIFAPNQYLITHFNVREDDDLIYQANRLDNNTKVFGFYSESKSYINEVINYQNLTAHQLITIK